MGRTLRKLFVFLCMAAGASLLTAQDFHADYPGKGVLTLNGSWRFHTSDDPAWASPALDDSHWESITADDTWGAQTHPGHTGFAWYRRAIRIDHVQSPLSISIPPTDDAYELYWNGKRIGGDGRLPPHASWKSAPTAHVFSLPEVPQDATLEGVLALRVWKSTLSSLDPNTLGGMHNPPTVGDTRLLITAFNLARLAYQHHNLIGILIGSFQVAFGLIVLGLWLRNRRETLYLWLALFLLAASGYGVLGFSVWRETATLEWSQLFIQLISSTLDISIWMMVLTLFGLDRIKGWRNTSYALISLYLLAQIIDTAVLFFWGDAGHGMQIVDGVTTTIYSVIPLYIFILLAAGLRRKRDLALVPVALACSLLELFNIVNGGLAQGQRFSHIDIQGLLQKLVIHVGDSYIIGTRSQITVLLLIVLAWTVVRQQMRESTHQQHLEDEVRSAREIQRVLVPEAVPPIEGLAISSLYWPAEEVGGDLFQIIPMSDGAAIIALADVSGKGLKAAMTVSLMVGTLRTLAEHTSSPANILTGLNRRLLGRTDGGFSTCVVLHIAPDGEVTMANAGHLSPFLNCDEMASADALPLGLDPDATFEEVRFPLAENDELTLYTDGVLEAMNARGELFGFDRCRDLMQSRPSVKTIAEQARAFGQKDDITAIKIVRVHHTDTRERITVDLQTVTARA